MATVYGVNATKRDVNVPADKIAAGEVNGKVMVAYDEYTASGALSNGDVIKLMKIPKGARLLDAVVQADDLGTTGTGKLGWEAGASAAEAADDDGIIASLDFNTAAARTRMTTAAGVMKKFTEEVQVSLTLTAATTAAGSIKVYLMYVVD
jgi:hypothetical protein